MMLKRAVIVVALAVGVLMLPGPASAGGFCSGYGGENFTDAAGTRVRMSENCFSPTVLRVAAGDRVTFVNADPEIHGVGGAAGIFGDAHKEIATGAKVTYRFDEEGVYPYTCIFHPGMSGAIVVGDGIGSPAAAGAVGLVDDGPAKPKAATPMAARGTSVPLAVGLGIALVLLLAAVAALVRRAARGTEVPSPS